MDGPAFRVAPALARLFCQQLARRESTSTTTLAPPLTAILGLVRARDYPLPPPVWGKEPRTVDTESRAGGVFVLRRTLQTSQHWIRSQNNLEYSHGVAERYYGAQRYGVLSTECPRRPSWTGRLCAESRGAPSGCAFCLERPSRRRRSGAGTPWAIVPTGRCRREAGAEELRSRWYSVCTPYSVLRRGEGEGAGESRMPAASAGASCPLLVRSPRTEVFRPTKCLTE